jgi:hypothetical protein
MFCSRVYSLHKKGAKMNRVCRFIVLLTALFAVSACAPLGNIGGDSGFDSDIFWVVPRRQYYTIGETFKKNNDLWVFASSRGIVESIPVSKVEIYLDPDDDPPSKTYLIDDEAWPLEFLSVGTGRKFIKVVYGNKTATYSIEVRNEFGTIDPDNTGPGIDFNWPK